MKTRGANAWIAQQKYDQEADANAKLTKKELEELARKQLGNEDLFRDALHEDTAWSAGIETELNNLASVLDDENFNWLKNLARQRHTSVTGLNAVAEAQQALLTSLRKLMSGDGKFAEELRERLGTLAHVEADTAALAKSRAL